MSTASLNKTLLIQENCVALNYLNSSILLPMMNLDVSVGQGCGGGGEDAAGELCHMVSGMATERCAQGQAESLRRELLCFTAA